MKWEGKVDFPVCRTESRYSISDRPLVTCRQTGDVKGLVSGDSSDWISPRLRTAIKLTTVTTEI